MGTENEPIEDDGPDIDPADLDDLGELGDEEEAEEAPYVAPSAEEYAKIKAKLERQERRINGLLGKDRKGRPAADVDRKLADQLRGKTRDEDEEDDGPDWRGIAIQSAAASHLQAAGFTGSPAQAARLAKLIDTSTLVPNRDGSFDLEDEVEELVDQYPALFGQGPAAGRRAAPAVRRADSRKAAPVDPTTATNRALLRQAGYPVR